MQLPASTPRFAGKATLAVVSDKVHDLRVVDVAADGTTVTLPVKAEWGAGRLSRRARASAARPRRRSGCPAASLGLAWFEVDRERAHARRSSSTRRSRCGRAATLRLPDQGRRAATPARRRASPSRRSMSASSTSPATRRRIRSTTSSARSSSRRRSATSTAISSTACRARAARSAPAATMAASARGHPADAGAARALLRRRARSGRTAPPRWRSTFRPSTAPCASWRSPGAQDRVGSASADVIVRDPVVLTGTLPRFLSVGDRSRFLMQVDNVEGPAGDYTVDLDVRGPMIVAGRRLALDLPARRRRPRAPVTIPVTAAGPGLAVVDVKLTGAGHRGRSQSFRSRVQPGTAALVRRTVRAARAGREPHRLERSRGRHSARHRRGVGLGVAARRARRAGRCCRRSTATPMAAPSRSSAARCRCSTSTSSRARRRWRSTQGSTSACATRSSACWRGRIRTARSACGRSAATICGSMPMSPIS